MNESILKARTADLSADLSDEVLTITLDRPERRNALSDAMLTELARLLTEADRDPRIGCVVITGAGDAFCAGGDVKRFLETGGAGGDGTDPDGAQFDRQRAEQRATVAKMRSMSTPVIASLPGPAAGAGLGLALAADLRIGSPKALMVPAFLKVGLSGDYGVAWLLTRLVGAARARQAMMLNEAWDASTLLQLGLLARVVPKADLAAETHRYAVTLAAGPRLALRHLKANLLDAQESGLLDAMDAEIARHLECGVSPDHREGLAAFADRREPAFGTRPMKAGMP